MSQNLKWCEISTSQNPRMDFLRDFLASKGIVNEFQFLECTLENIKEKIDEARNAGFHIRFGTELFDKVAPYLENNVRELEELNSVDSVSLDKGKYWPTNVIKDSIFEYLTLRTKSLDVTQKAFIVGDCGLARAGISALVKLGFSKINIAGSTDEKAEKLVSDLSKIFFHVQFETTKRKDITILPGVHGLVFNTFSVLDTEIFPSEIYFFNYLKKGGLVVDTQDIPVDSPLIRIAKDIGAQDISGYEMMAYYDLLWFNKASGQKADLAEYIEYLKSKLAQVKYDEEPIKKVLEEFQI